MGMVLQLTTASDATLARVHAFPPLVWQLLAPDDPEIYEDAAREYAPGGWGGRLRRLFGGGSRVSPPPDLELGSDEVTTWDMDKAWHGAHFVLTETAWEGKPPLDFLVRGGREIGRSEEHTSELQ